MKVKQRQRYGEGDRWQPWTHERKSGSSLKRFEKGPPHGVSTAASTSGETEHIYRGPDMFYMLSSEGNQRAFVAQLFQQSDDVHTAAMLKQIGDDVKRKQDQRRWDLRQVIWNKIKNK